MVTVDRDRVPVDVMTGEIDVETRAIVEAELAAQVDKQPNALTINLNAIDFLHCAYSARRCARHRNSGTWPRSFG